MGRGGRLRRWRWWCASRPAADFSHGRPPPRSPLAPMASCTEASCIGSLPHRPLPAPDPAPRHAPVILAKARTHGHRRAHRRKNAQSLCWPPPPQKQQRHQRQTPPQGFGSSLSREKACTVWPKPANWRAPEQASMPKVQASSPAPPWSSPCGSQPRVELLPPHGARWASAAPIGRICCAGGDARGWYFHSLSW